MHELGDLLKRLRGDLSLREVAKRSGLSYSYISSLEKGKHPRTGAQINPTPDILRSLAKAYNYPHEELMRLAGYLDKEEMKDRRDPAQKLIEYLEMELTDEEIIERMNFKVDDLTLSVDEVKEFIAFVRAKRFMKLGQPASASKPGEL